MWISDSGVQTGCESEIKVKFALGRCVFGSGPRIRLLVRLFWYAWGKACSSRQATSGIRRHEDVPFGSDPPYTLPYLLRLIYSTFWHSYMPFKEYIPFGTEAPYTLWHILIDLHSSLYPTVYSTLRIILSGIQSITYLLLNSVNEPIINIPSEWVPVIFF